MTLKVLFVNRPDALTVPGGDTTQMLKTKEALERRGVKVDVALTLSPDAAGYDLAHVFNLSIPYQTLSQASALRKQGVPVVLSPIYWDLSENWWASRCVPAVFSQARGEAELEQFLKGIADRTLALGDLKATTRNLAYPNFEEEQRKALEAVDYLLPNSQAEMAQLRLTLGACAIHPFTVVPNAVDAGLFLSATPDRFVERFGLTDFVICAGRIEGRKNQLMLLYALRECGLPIVLAGASYDQEYLALCHQYAPPQTLFAGPLSAVDLASAFAAARVHALPSWLDTPGLASLEAALAGCPVVVGNRGAEREYFQDEARYCDPASVAAIREAVWEAYHTPRPEVQERLRHRILTQYTWDRAAEMTVTGYQEALDRGPTNRLGVPGEARPLVSIIIPTYNKWEYTAKCLTKLAENTKGIPIEIIVVDNASTDGTRERLEQLSQACRVHLNDTNLGFAKASNQGARMARGKYLLFLNNDTEPQPGWLAAMLKVVEADPSVAIVGSKLLFPDGTVQHGGVAFLYAAAAPISPVHLDYRRPAIEAGNHFLELKAVTAACMLIRPEVFWQVGGFDEEYVNGYEDVDLCLKVWEAGGRIIYTPESVLIHHESVSDGRFLKTSENIELLHRRWMGRFTAFDYNAFTDAQPFPGDPDRPGVSVVLVTHNSLQTIAPCLESLALYTGPQDEIILVDNASTDGTMRFIEDFSEAHPGRLKVLRQARNLGLAGGLSRGLEEATKDYVALLYPDVQVTPAWLDRMLAHLTSDASVAAVGPLINRAGEQEADASVCREWKSLNEIAAQVGERHSGEAREVRSLLGNCTLCRRKDLEDLGLDPELFAGFAGLDLSLRWRQQGRKLLVAADVVVKHWCRVSMTQETLLRRKYLLQQSANALYERLYRSGGGRAPFAQELGTGTSFAPQSGLVSIIILVRDNLDVTRQCIESVYEHTHRAFELILVDNGSGPGVGEYAAELQRVYGNVTYIRNDENQGYAFGCNQGLAVARGEYVVLLNNDVVVAKGWLGKQLALLALDPSVGIVGPSTNRSAERQQVVEAPYRDLADFPRFAADWSLENAGRFTLTSRITGVCMVLRREVVEKVGGFDTCFGIGNMEDDDFCLRAVRAGYLIAIAHDVFVHHWGNSTFKSLKVDYGRLLEENWRFFCYKWNHRGDMKDGYMPLQLASARPFDPGQDHIPPCYDDVFSPEATPLALGETQPVRFLCIPDWHNPAWRRVVGAYLRAFTAEDPVSLIIRVEPPLPEEVDKATQQIMQLLEKTGVPEASVPDIVLETSAIPPRRRGGLYTAATAFLPCAGSRAGLYAREAKACGLPVVEPTAKALRGWVAGRQTVSGHEELKAVAT
ncbi:MAG: glycosyltransferase [Bacillota bacterium]|nr:glycosyltransferase [Bacillota bacterium]